MDKKLNIIYKGQEYPLATTLRVAFTVQGQNEHKPYTEVFAGIDDMPVEKQIGIVYASVCAATHTFKTAVPEKDFREDFLDRYNLKDLMDILKSIINGIMGKSDNASEESEEDSEAEGNE